MKTIRIVFSIYEKISIANFILLMEAIILAVKGNPNYPTPQPPITELESQLATLQSQATAVKAGNFTLKPARDLSKQTLLALVKQLSTYCLYQATQSSDSIEEAAEKLRSVHFVLAERGQNIGPLPAPGNVRGKSLTQSVEIEFEAVKGAQMYLILKTDGLPTETSVWTEIITPRVKHVIENINAGSMVTVRVCALGPVGKGQLSDYCTVMAGM